jgi:peptide/nickel transport system permease protein
VRAYLIKRLLGLLPVLLGLSVMIFLAMKLIPGDVTQTLLGPMATEATVAQLRSSLGLDQPIHMQYAKWLWRTLQGDLGMSPIVRKPVAEILMPKFWNTLVLAGASFVLAAGMGVAVGMLAAARQGSALDRLGIGTSLVVGNMPPFWLGLTLIALFAIKLRWLPSLGMYSLRGGGGVADLLLHLLLPAATTAAAPGAIIARMTRASVLEILGQDYIKVARAKGLPERVVIGAHALRVAAPPIVTICGLQVGYLLGGAVFTEEVFGWPGLGRQLVSSVIARDIQVVQGAVLFIALSFVLVNLVVDSTNLMLDARTRVG